jgi:hypothetical protein
MCAATMMVGRFVVAFGIVGMMEASAYRRERSGSTSGVGRSAVTTL